MANAPTLHGQESGKRMHVGHMRGLRSPVFVDTYTLTDFINCIDRDLVSRATSVFAAGWYVRKRVSLHGLMALLPRLMHLLGFVAPFTLCNCDAPQSMQRAPCGCTPNATLVPLVAIGRSWVKKRNFPQGNSLKESDGS